mgnify:CR=1 FL=1
MSRSILHGHKMKKWIINKLLGFKPYQPLNDMDDKRVWPEVEYTGDEAGATAKSQELSGKERHRE